MLAGAELAAQAGAEAADQAAAACGEVAANLLAGAAAGHRRLDAPRLQTSPAVLSHHELQQHTNLNNGGFQDVHGLVNPLQQVPAGPSAPIDHAVHQYTPLSYLWQPGVVKEP